jgi:hypothetical protein
MSNRRGVDDAARQAWLTQLPAVCRAIGGASSSEATTFARWLVREQWARLAADLRAAAALTPLAAALREQTRLAPACLGVVEANRVVGDRELHREIVTFLTSGEDVYPVEAGVHLLRTVHREGGRDLSSRFGLETLYSHCASVLAARLETPVREPGNWSIAAPQRCRCTLCRTLGEFLAAQHRVQFEWPLAKDARRHAHQVIDASALPVSHVTRRSGRPFTLVLRKTDALFVHEAAQRRKWQQDLAWLQRVAGNRGANGV